MCNGWEWCLISKFKVTILLILLNILSTEVHKKAILRILQTFWNLNIFLAAAWFSLIFSNWLCTHRILGVVHISCIKLNIRQSDLNRHLSWVHYCKNNPMESHLQTGDNRWLKPPWLSSLTHFNLHFFVFSPSKSLSPLAAMNRLTEDDWDDIQRAQQPFCATCCWLNMLNVLIPLKRKGKSKGSQRANSALDTKTQQMFIKVPDVLSAQFLAWCTRLLYPAN